jgi:hypothetical protein
MPEHQGGEEYELRLRAAPGEVPPAQRLKALLEFAGRHLGLRCVSCADVTPVGAAGEGEGPRAPALLTPRPPPRARRRCRHGRSW